VKRVTVQFRIKGSLASINVHGYVYPDELGEYSVERTAAQMVWDAWIWFELTTGRPCKAGELAAKEVTPAQVIVNRLRRLQT
jgi:hypothetical protein